MPEAKIDQFRGSVEADVLPDGVVVGFGCRKVSMLFGKVLELAEGVCAFAVGSAVAHVSSCVGRVLDSYIICYNRVKQEIGARCAIIGQLSAPGAIKRSAG